MYSNMSIVIQTFHIHTTNPCPIIIIYIKVMETCTNGPKELNRYKKLRVFNSTRWANRAVFGEDYRWAIAIQFHTDRHASSMVQCPVYCHILPVLSPACIRIKDSEERNLVTIVNTAYQIYQPVHSNRVHDLRSRISTKPTRVLRPHKWIFVSPFVQTVVSDNSSFLYGLVVLSQFWFLHQSHVRSNCQNHLVTISALHFRRLWFCSTGTVSITSTLLSP